MATTPKGLPPYVAAELRALGFPVLQERDAWVETSGTLADTLRLNLHLRTAHRVLFRLKQFHARDAEVLYNELSRIPWEDYVDESGYVCVDSSVTNETIRDTRFASMKAKDAIVDRIRRRCGRRPDAGPDETRGVCVFLHWRGTEGTVYLNTTGEPLAKRGYRHIPYAAPMQETLAAGVVSAMGWNGTGVFANPMCGSGTLAIEAASLALNKAPGLLRNRFAFMQLRGYDRGVWKRLRSDAARVIKDSFPGRILATDSDAGAVAAARQNARDAGVDRWIEFAVCDFAETPLPEPPGVLVLNPPYGERLGEASELEPLYHRIGDFFKQKCLGYRGFVFAGNLELAKRVGLRTCSRRTFYNGRIECRLLGYELYAGTRRVKEDSEESLESDDSGSS